MSKQSRNLKKLCDKLEELGNHYIAKCSPINGHNEQLTTKELEIALNMGSFYTWLQNYDVFKKAKMLYHRFDLLDAYVNAFGFSPVEKADIIFEVMKRNIAIGILKFDAKSVDQKRKSPLNYERLMEQFRRPSKNYMQSFERVFLATIEESLDNNFLALGGTSISHFDNLKQLHNLLNERLFTNNDMNDKDVGVIMKALEPYFLDQTLVGIKLYLQNKLANQEKIREEDIKKEALRLHIYLERETIQSKLVPSSKVMSKKEYNALYHELLSYFDFDNMRAIRYLKMNEIMRCLIILRQLSFNDDVINLFLATIDTYNQKSGEHAIIRYMDLKEKLQYYKDTPEVVDLLKEVEEAFQRTFMASCDDYEFLKQYLDMELNLALDHLKDNYSYEHQKVLTIKPKEKDN